MTTEKNTGELGVSFVTLVNLRMAAKPLFFYLAKNFDDPKDVSRSHCKGPAFSNERYGSERIQLNFWGMNAINAGKYLDTGKQLTIFGSLTQYDKKTGQMNASGKEIIESQTEVRVEQIIFGSDSMKKIEVYVMANASNWIQKCKNKGLLPENVSIPALLAETNAQELISNRERKQETMTWKEARTAGHFHGCRVWDKEVGGFWDEHPVSGIHTTTNQQTINVNGVQMTPEQIANAFALLQQQINAVQTGKPAPVNPTTYAEATMETGTDNTPSNDPF